jgi:hypothetical protein
MNQRLLLLAAVACGAIFCALFVFHTGFDNGFLPRDVVLLEHAASARGAGDVVASRWVEPFNRPLSQLAFWTEYRLLGFDAGRYVRANVLLHVVNAVLLAWLLIGPLGPQAAAVAALLFALGFGFYGKAILTPGNLPDLLATCFALGTGVVARQAQLARLPQQRAGWMTVAGGLYALALACKESGIMAMVMVGGLLWPHRRSIGSVVRKIAVLVVICIAYLGFQFLGSSGVTRVAENPRIWLSLPLRALRLATFMTIPVVPEVHLTATAGPLLARGVELLDQVRPVLGLVILGLATLWFVRGSGAARWLLVAYLAFLLPFGLIHLPEGALDIRDAYMPATVFCALLAHGLRALWLRSGGFRRFLLVILMFVSLAADVMLVRRLEWSAQAAGEDPGVRARIQEIERAAAAFEAPEAPSLGPPR